MFVIDERWRKPSRSGNNGQCVEARQADGAIQVRNSTDPDGSVVSFTMAEWDTFRTAIVVDDEFRIA